MKFEYAYSEMLKGKKIKRPCFKGYWYVDGITGKLTIHLANGSEITEGDLGLTVTNVLAEDWFVYEDYEEVISVRKDKRLLEGGRGNFYPEITPRETFEYYPCHNTLTPDTPSISCTACNCTSGTEPCVESYEEIGYDSSVDYTDGIGDGYVITGDSDLRYWSGEGSASTCGCSRTTRGE